MNLQMEKLLKAYQAGNFLETVLECAIQDHDSSNTLPTDLATLHNDGLIDIVAEFSRLENSGQQGNHFFSTRHIFEKALPLLKASVLSVMQCSLGLVRKAGQDMAASWIIDGFIEFCVNVPSRIQDAIKEIENNPDDFAEMLPATIASGMKVDIPQYLAEIIRLKEHLDISIRRGAIYSLALIPWSEGAAVPDPVFTMLEEVVEKEEDDQILANTLNSVFSLSQQDETYNSRALKVIGDALAKGNNLTLHAASTVFGSHTNKLQPSILELLISQLMHVNPEHKGTIDNIDYGISHLLKTDSLKAIQVLEELLLAYPDKLKLKTFDSAMAEIRANPFLISKVTTRWLLSGEFVLCEGVHEIVGKHYGKDLFIDVDILEIEQLDFTHIIFFARKAIGYLFIKPITIASIIISLMRNTQDAEILQQLGDLLFNPLLLNYTGSLRDFLKNQYDDESGKPKEIIGAALKSIDDYLCDLRNIPELPSLHPSQAQRESYQRYMSELMAKSSKAAERDSVFMNFFSRSTILYGKKAIYYVQTAIDGPPQRSEMEMASHSVEMEFPRMDTLDRCSVNYMLQFFRRERLIK